MDAKACHMAIVPLYRAESRYSAMHFEGLICRLALQLCTAYSKFSIFQKRRN
jgi:hypothetical protein